MVSKKIIQNESKETEIKQVKVSKNMVFDYDCKWDCEA